MEGRGDYFSATFSWTSPLSDRKVPLEAVTRGGKNTSGHRTRLFRSRCLKSLIVIPGNRGVYWDFTGVHFFYRFQWGVHSRAAVVTLSHLFNH